MRECLLVLLAGLFSASLLPAQNATGSIVGHVKDVTDAVVVAARVSVTNVDTHEIRTVLTNEAGDYTIPVLQPGHYEVEVTDKGFKSEKRSGIVLDVDQIVRVETTLAAGSSTESVTVNATALGLDTDSASVGQLIGSELISELPLDGRNFQDLMFISPGAVNNAGGNQSTYRLTISGSDTSAVSLGGSRGSSEGYTVDGTTILDINYDTPAFGPSLDDIAEFDELTKSYSAAYGYSMNQINITSKSGTNSYHGSAFEYLRNNTVDASIHGFTPGEKTSLLQQNQFGYSLGGPLRIPWLYNGRNKTFFFANYEGFRQNIGGGSSPTDVPLADELMGKFDADVLGTFTPAQAPAGVGYTQCGHTYQAGDPHPLFNPYDPNGCPFPMAADGSYTIPSAMISNLGKLMMRPGLYFPAGPNVPGAAIGVNNYVYSSKSYLNYDQQNYRVDQNIGAKDQIFFHAVKHDEAAAGTGAVLVGPTVQTQPARLYTMTETHVFSPNITNQFRLGYNQAISIVTPAAVINPTDLSSLNWPNPYTAYSEGEGYPRLEFDSSPLNDGLCYCVAESLVNSINSNITNSWDLGESAIWNYKRHTISFGFDGRAIRLIIAGGASLGRVNYNGQYSGDILADALLGASPGVQVTQVGPLSNPNLGPIAHLHFHRLAPYVQDDWKVNDKLTLNLGLRYEFNATPFEEQNSFMWPDFNAPGGALYTPNTKIAAAYGGVNPFSAATGIYVPSPGGERGPGPAVKNAWAPRVGFAYRIFGDDKTVVRGGFGKYFDTIEANEYQASSVGIYPGSASVSTSTDAGLSYPPAFNTNNLPLATPGGPLVSYYTNNPANGYTNGASTLGFIQIQADHWKNPYYLAWNLGVERQLPWATKLEIDYVANHGADLFSRSNPNAPTQCLASNGCMVTANTPATVPVELRRPYKNLGLLVYAGFDGFANYNAMDVKVEHRAHDLDLVASYTWSQALDTKSAVAAIGGDNAGWAGPQDGHNISADYARGNFDVGQRLAITAVYPLPLGRGRPFLGNAPRLVDEAVGGWNIGLLSAFQGGLPFTIAASDIQGANNTYSERANVNPTPSSFHRSHAQWFDFDPTPGSTDATYTQPAPGYYGDSARDAVRGPGTITADMSLSKHFPITEKTGVELRFDAFNAFNHWNPGAPGGTVNGNPSNSSCSSNGNGTYSGPGCTVGVIFPSNSQKSARILQISGRFTF